MSCIEQASVADRSGSKLCSSSNDEFSNQAAPNESYQESSDKSVPKNKSIATDETSTLRQRKAEISSSSSRKQIQQQGDDFDGNNMNYAYNIPTTGTSLDDSLNKEEEFITTLTPILNVGTCGVKIIEILYDDNGFPIGAKDEVSNDVQKQQHEGLARIDTVSTSGNMGEEPVRWLVSLKDPTTNDDCQPYFMIDIPPYSESLANEIKYFMDPNFNKTEVGASPMKGKLDAILVTNQQSIHYDQSPGVYVTRKSDLEKWKKAFPDVKVIIYRIDQPRDCRESVTQVLDGYGPWGWDETSDVGFVQTGRPLQIEEWDKTTASNVLKLGETPPDDKDDDATDARNGNDDGMYSKEAIREREKNHDLLAVYTPGHTFGSITFVFPNRGICCSGYALPLESASADGFVDIEDEEAYPSAAVAPQGPRLDYQGYIASSVSRPRQMSSASKLINDYIDRFKIVLPARGDVVFLDNDVDTRKRELMENVGLYAKISEIYGRLGIAE
jgi:glyoxylase-like metal-dependent hydrolase (beta-lactamase superfamily II)